LVVRAVGTRHASAAETDELLDPQVGRRIDVVLELGTKMIGTERGN
jgi:hypothetical protein